jgi:hypothetical protein
VIAVFGHLSACDVYMLRQLLVNMRGTRYAMRMWLARVLELQLTLSFLFFCRLTAGWPRCGRAPPPSVRRVRARAFGCRLWARACRLRH